MCGKLEEQCDDGTPSQRIRGEMTRKYKQQAGPGGEECIPAFIEGQDRLTKAPCYVDCEGNFESVLISFSIRNFDAASKKSNV